MARRDASREEDRGGSAAIIGGYAGFAFGLLAVVSTASEVATPTIGGAAVILLVCMVTGAVAGWALGPLFKSLFGQS